MNNNSFLELLGLRFNKLISDFHYPPLHPSLFTVKNCEEIRSHLSGVSDQNEKLQRKIAKLINKGNIEEIDKKNDSLIIGVEITHKSELYLLELKLNNFKWSFNSIHYLGLAPRKKLIWMLSSALAFSILLVLLLLSKNLEQFSVENTEGPNENREIEVVSEELQRIAKDNQYILLTQEELDDLLEETEKKLDNEKEHIVSTPEITHNNENENENEKDKTVIITIESGMSSYDVAVLLEKNGLARSVNEIEQLFIELRVQKKIRSGTFTFSVESTYLEIIQQLIGAGS